ncbi:MAG: tetratricopeptide repeat protein [Bacteroidia bacterium]|nr:tetratricopeptide repeat protein [Bacteroidia bacterium]
MRYIFVWGFTMLFLAPIFGQGGIDMDSLENLYTQGIADSQELIEVVEELANHHPDAHKKVFYSDILLDLAATNEDPLTLYTGYFRKGNALLELNEYSEALSSFFKGAEMAIEEERNDLLGKIQIPIADVYSLMGNHENAVSYYNEAIALLRKTNDSVSLASALLNAGDEYSKKDKFDAALALFDESGVIFERINFRLGTAYNIGNMGMINAKKGNNELAQTQIQEAIGILEEYEDYSPISEYLTYMADIYADKQDLERALIYAHTSLELATKYEMRDEISMAHDKLSEIYELDGNTEASFKHYKDHIKVRDSLVNLEAVRSAEAERTNYEVAQKQAQVDLLNEQGRTQRIMVLATIIGLVLVGLLAIGLFRRNRFIQKTNQVINTEKERSESLLLNILPKETAKELKEEGRVKAKKFLSVSVLFTDFENFTRYAEALPPEKLVESVDFYYSKFDAIMEKYGLEKIKTIGDAYMAAAGLPFPMQDHAVRMVKAALEITEFVKTAKENEGDEDVRFNIRVGINSGPVVAGVVGTRKFAYDIWGDTVNVAARMESMSEPGQINISEDTYALVKDHFECEYRGEFSAKNRGKLKMYYVSNPSAKAADKEATTISASANK